MDGDKPRIRSGTPPGIQQSSRHPRHACSSIAEERPPDYPDHSPPVSSEILEATDIMVELPCIGAMLIPVVLDDDPPTSVHQITSAEEHSVRINDVHIDLWLGKPDFNYREPDQGLRSRFGTWSNELYSCSGS